MTLPEIVDLARVVEQLVPQAAFGTARKTDIDADDYAALERTWHDTRALPTREMLEAARLAYIAERELADQNRVIRRNTFLLALENDPGEITAGEISSISSLADAKLTMLKMARLLRLFRAALAILREDSKVLE
jgi:hypothetical protein